MAICVQLRFTRPTVELSLTFCASSLGAPAPTLIEDRIVVSAGDSYFGTEVSFKKMDAMVVGATLVGSIATAFFVQRAVLAAMLRAFARDKARR